MDTMTLAEKFWEWDRFQRIRWKDGDHEFKVRQFDAEAKVEYFSRCPDGDGYYDGQTYVTFSDGSKTYFNYKGE